MYWPILALFGTKKGLKIWPTGTIFHTHLRVPNLCLYTKLHGPVSNLLGENIQNLQNSQLLPIFVIKKPLKKLRKKSKFQQHNFLGKSVVYIQSKYQKDRMKTQETYSISTKVDDRQRDWWLCISTKSVRIGSMFTDREYCESLPTASFTPIRPFIWSVATKSSNAGHLWESVGTLCCIYGHLNVATDSNRCQHINMTTKFAIADMTGCQ